MNKSRRLIYSRKAIGGKVYQLVSVVQEADLWAQIERLRGEDIEVITVEDVERIYYAVYKVVIEAIGFSH